MSKEFQNMDPNATSSLDDDHTKFRARFERLGTFSLAYDPALLQASPDSSSTVSRSPLQPVKIRTDWSRPDLDEDQDKELTSSGLCKLSPANLEDSRISNATTQECQLPELDFNDSSTILKGFGQESVPSSPVIATVLTNIDLRRESESGLSAILHTSSDNESDMELSSTCGTILLDRTEGEVHPSSPSAVYDALGESALSEPEPDNQSDFSVPSDEKEPEGLLRETSLDNEIASVGLSLPECEPSPVIAPRKRDSQCSMISEQCEETTKQSESEFENVVDYINMTPVKRPLVAKSTEGTPARVLFPSRARSAEGTPVKAAALFSRNANVLSSFNLEGTPSRRNRAIDQVHSEVPELVVRLNSKHDDWTRRIEALKRISKFTTFHMSVASLAEALLPLLDPLALQLQDLRSQIVKQACITIGDLAVCLGLQFQPFARCLFPRLLDLLRIAKKVMSSAGDDCLHRIITHSHVDAIDIIIKESVSNKSPIVRCRCLEYALLALQKWDADQLVSYQPSLGSLFSKVCSDSTKDVRTAGKRLFYEYSRIWSDDSRRLFQALDLKLQKGILTDFPDLHSVVSFSDDEFTAAGAHIIQQTPSRLSLAEIKANLRRESLANAHADDDLIFVERSPIRASSHLAKQPTSSLPEAPKTPTKAFDFESNELTLGLVPPRSPSLTFKFDQPYPSVHHDRDRLALSPIPVEFLEGFPVPAPVRAHIPPDCRLSMHEPSPLVKHSSRKFTSRVFGTPINGKFDESVNDDDSSSSTSTCPTVDQALDEADDNGQISVSSSVAAGSLDVLSRIVAPSESSEFDQPNQGREMLMLESKLQYLRIMATSVFDECESPVRTIEIHHDLTTSALESTSQGHKIQNVVSDIETEAQERDVVVLPETAESRILTPQRNELTCDSTLKVGNLSFEASKSPKVVLNAVLSSPSSEHVFKSPDCTPIPTPSRRSSFSRRPKDDDTSILRSILFVLLSMIMFAILLHGLPEFLRPSSDGLISHSKLQYSHSEPKLVPPLVPVQKVDIPIRDSGELIFESSADSHESAFKLNEDVDSNNIECESESSAKNLFNRDPQVQLHDQSEEDCHSVEDISHSAASSSDFQEISNAGDAFQPEPVHEVYEPNSDSIAEPIDDPGPPLCSEDLAAAAVDTAKHVLPLNFEIADSLDFQGNASDFFDHPSATHSESSENPVDISDDVDDRETTSSESSQSEGSSHYGIQFTPKFAYLYSVFVAAICWVTYRIRSVPIRAPLVDRDPDFDLTGVTMAPEWDINLDSVLPSGPSPLPHPGGTDYQKWNQIKKDGTTMTLFSPLRRTLRIRRPRRPTQF